MNDCFRFGVGRGRVLWAWVFVPALVGATAAPPARADGKVGLLDFQHLLTSLRAMEGGRVEGDVRPRSEEIERLDRELKHVKEQYARERPQLGPEARERYEREIFQRTEAIQRLYGEAARESLFKVRLRPVEEVRLDLERLIQRVGRERGFALILDDRDHRVLYRAEGAEEGAKGEETNLTKTFLDLFLEELRAGRIGAPAGK